MPDISPPVTAVDLSRLPAPDTVEQLAYETIFASKVALVQAALAALEAPVAFDATVESDPAVKLLQRAAYDELLARQDCNDRLKRMMLAFATGSAIDHIAAPFGVTRLVSKIGRAHV